MNVASFLIEFGYLDAAEAGNPAAVAAAIAKAQELYGLPVTGEADEMTVRAFARTPRCGVTDAEEAREAINRWGVKHLTYAIEATPRGRDLDPERATHAIRAAFQSWSNVCGLTFEQIDNRESCNLLIGVGRGPRAGFDGSGGTLAWAELPPSEGHRRQLEMRFDLDENFVVGQSPSGILLENVACHEIGHLIGLSHTNVSGSLMLPTYSPRVARPQADDILRARNRYGDPKPRPTPAPEPTPAPGGRLVEVEMRLDGAEVFHGVLQPGGFPRG